MFDLLLEDNMAIRSTSHMLEHPLLDILESVYQTGSIVKAARQLGRSYRHVWGELKSWELELNANLIVWGRNGKGATLTPQAVEFLIAVSKTRVDLAPQLAQIQKRFQQCVGVLKMSTQHSERNINTAFLITFKSRWLHDDASVTKV